MKRIIPILLIFFSCQNEENKTEREIISEVAELQLDKIENLSNYTDSIFALNGLVDIQSVDKRIEIELRYATKNNFMGVELYDTLKKAYLQQDVALRLSKVQTFLDSLKPGFRLCVYDAARPVQVQWEMWNAMDSIPYSVRGKFVSNPALGSVHNFGAAVDLTIVDNEGNKLDMGAEYDDFREIAFPSKEQFFLNSGELTKHQYANRKLLRRVMASQKFRNIPSEWWHFNAFSRITASHKYQMLKTESGDVEWFLIETKNRDRNDSTSAVIGVSVEDSLSKN